MVTKLLKAAIAVIATVQIVQAAIFNKWQILEEFGTIFIEEEQKYNWFEAWNECAMRNMTLIAIDSAEKNHFLEALLRKRFQKCPNLWIGGNDLGEEGKFIWSATGKRLEFSNWSKGNPDNYNNNEHCMHYFAVTDFEWNDAPCSAKLGFICEESKHFCDESFY